MLDLLKLIPFFTICIFLIVAICSYSFLKWDLNKRANLIVLSLTTIVIFYTIELFLSFGATSWASRDLLQNMRANEAKKKDLKFDLRKRLEVLDAYRQKDANVVTTISGAHIFSHDYKNLTFVPLGGISNRNTLFCNENGDWVSYKSDEYGFRNPKGTIKKGLDIALIGDSYVHGSCVGEGKDLTGLFRSQGLKAANFGLAGSNGLIQFMVFKEYIAKVKPKNVMWFYYEGNDLVSDSENPFGFRADDLSSNFINGYLYEHKDQNLISKQAEIDEFFTKILKEEEDRERRNSEISIKLNEVILLKKIGDLVVKAFYKQPVHYARYQVRREDVKLYMDIIMAAKKETESWGGNFYFVYLPSWLRFVSDDDSLRLSKNMPYLAFRERFIYSESGDFLGRKQVLNELNKIGVKVIDTLEDFEERSDPLSLTPWRLYGHYTESGYEVVFSKAYKAIINTNK